jgi:predicted phage tail protein
MTYLFAFPLVLGVGGNLTVAGVGYIAGKTTSDKPASTQSLNSTATEKGSPETSPKNSTLYDIAINLYYFGIAALTASSMLRGIFDIAGTASVYQTYLMYAGAAMTIGGVVAFLLSLVLRKK